MTEPPPPPEPPPPTPWMPPNAHNTPNAEKYLLEADALRRRQLRSAMLHGSSRTWREQKRIWPSVIAGVLVVAVIVATFFVIKAIHQVPDTTPTLPPATAPVTTPPVTTPSTTDTTKAPGTTGSSTPNSDGHS